MLKAVATYKDDMYGNFAFLGLSLPLTLFCFCMEIQSNFDKSNFLGESLIYVYISTVGRYMSREKIRRKTDIMD